MSEIRQTPRPGHRLQKQARAATFHFARMSSLTLIKGVPSHWKLPFALSFKMIEDKRFHATTTGLAYNLSGIPPRQVSFTENLCLTNSAKPWLMDYLFDSKFNITKFQRKSCDRLRGCVARPLITSQTPHAQSHTSSEFEAGWHFLFSEVAYEKKMSILQF